jgi:hypothetical protein
VKQIAYPSPKSARVPNPHLIFLGQELSIPNLLFHLALAILIAILIFREMRFLEDKIGPDFAQDFRMAQSIVNNRPIYNTSHLLYQTMDQADQKVARSHFGTAHPPSSGVFFIPYLNFEFQRAYRAHALLSILMIGAATLLMAHACTYRSGTALLLVAFAIVYGPNVDGFRYGQLSPALSSLVIFSWLALRNGKDILAGVLLGTAAALKLYPFLAIIYFLAQRRHYAAFATFMTFAAFAIGIPYLYSGSFPSLCDGWQMYFLEVSSENIRGWLTFEPVLSIGGVLANLFSLQSLFPVSQQIIHAIPAIIILLATPCLFLLCRRYPTVDTGYVALLLAMPALAPISHPHGLFLIWPALLIIAANATPHKLPYAGLVVLMVLLGSSFTQVGWWEIAKTWMDYLDLPESHSMRVYFIKLHTLLYYVTVFLFLGYLRKLQLP